MTIERKEYKSIIDKQHEVHDWRGLLTERITEYVELTNFHLKNQNKKELELPDFKEFTELEMLIHMERCVIQYAQAIGDNR